MNPPSALVALALLLSALPLRPQADAQAAPAPDSAAAEAEARSSVLDLAGAFSNDGYKIRDGFWFSGIEPDQSAIIQVNLFAGNEYWFCAAANAPATKIVVTVHDETGAVIDQQDYQDGPRAAAGVVAERSGPYLVKISLAPGEKGSFCLLYCYK